ncbi:hypothetical protein Tsp_10308 [Trichinella spiralis]|uniref:hypothetical protein n=1 Tax=Trichinella spiralis TaxID=6334 RepID=UPI0001EFE1D5|nr:hypothetical protein Tsp_10308 [Trichinella spiralis]
MLTVEEELQMNVILLVSQQCGQDAAFGFENNNVCKLGWGGKLQNAINNNQSDENSWAWPMFTLYRKAEEAIVTGQEKNRTIFNIFSPIVMHNNSKQLSQYEAHFLTHLQLIFMHHHLSVQFFN